MCSHALLCLHLCLGFKGVRVRGLACSWVLTCMYLCVYRKASSIDIRPKCFCGSFPWVTLNRHPRPRTTTRECIIYCHFLDSALFSHEDITVGGAAQAARAPRGTFLLLLLAITSPCIYGDCATSWDVYSQPLLDTAITTFLFSSFSSFFAAMKISFWFTVTNYGDEWVWSFSPWTQWWPNDLRLWFRRLFI